MIQIQRSLARNLRAVFRKLVKKPASTERSIVSIRADRSGLKVRLHNADVLAEYQQAGSYSPETIIVSFEALADFDGKGNGTVTLENAGPGNVQARWDDAGVPQVKDYDAVEVKQLASYATAPADMTPIGTGLLKAIADASESAARESVRYAMTNIQLRGRAGEIVATDGRQLLLQSGFKFPFTDDLLIPSSTVFACKELSSGGEVSIGVGKEYVTIQTGGWNFHFKIDKNGRFPRSDQVIPAQAGIVTRWRLDPEDVTFLVKSLPRLPGEEDENSPVTIDLNSQAVVRAKASDQARPTEVVLAKSAVSGKAVRFCANRDLLERTLALGFMDFGVVNADTPIVAQDARRKFVFMPLDKKEAIAPSDDGLRITSAEVEEPVARNAPIERPDSLLGLDPLKVDTKGNGQSNGVSHQEASSKPRTRKVSGKESHSVLQEVAALKNVLRDAYTRTHHLMLALQRQKKQSQAVRATLASLRQLQHLDVEG